MTIIVGCKSAKFGLSIKIPIFLYFFRTVEWKNMDLSNLSKVVSTVAETGLRAAWYMYLCGTFSKETVAKLILKRFQLAT